MRLIPDSIRKFLRNRWTRFIFWSAVYILWFVVWTGQPLFLIGEIFLFDLFITRLFNRKVWSRHKDLKKRNGLYREVMGWVEAIVFALVFATLIHIYVFQLYKIPTSSMEKTMLVGDHLYVSKPAFGPRMPMTPVAFPLVHHTMPFSSTRKSFSEAVSWKYRRLKGTGTLQRDDIVVFNFPAGDTVLVENQAVTYYDVLHDYQQTLGETEGRERLQRDYTVISRPVDMREHYVKRCVAVAGDTLRIEDGVLYVNSAEHPLISEMEYVYFVQVTRAMSRSEFRDLGVAEDDIQYSREQGIYVLPLTQAMADRLRSSDFVVSVTRYVDTQPSHAIFPNVEPDSMTDPQTGETLYNWTADSFGPLWVPSKGATVRLTRENIPLYRRIIDVYEGNDLQEREDGIYINGERADSYTFAMDYYFMMGDNRHNSADSRFWGFVPEDHIVGRPVFVYLSTDKDLPFPRNIRWNRMFRHVR